MNTNKAVVLAGIVGLGLGGCAGTENSSADDLVLAQQIAQALTTSCPMSGAADEQARAQCAANLSDSKSLAAVMQEPFLWGGQKPGSSYHLEESNTNRFNVFVWRRMYLSLLMFPGNMTIEQTADGLTVVHMPYQFRNALDMGSYPYPFWHSKKKWDSYQLAPEIALIIKNGKWIGALRSPDQDMSHSQVAHTWSGQWRWEQGAEPMPYVSLYKYLLSPKNPNVERVDAAYRALSDGLRAQSCFMCHSPDNHANQTQLEFFNYPNQALYSRNSIISDLQANVMPPPNNDLGLPAGIANTDDRQELITLAQEFKAAGDAALTYEGELKPVVFQVPGGSAPSP
jgi:hypothetical protein